MAGLLLAQEPAPVRVNVRLVQVNVIVTDQAGEPITNLDKDDFEITDNGKLQKISFFETENVNEAKRFAPLPENTFSNRTPTGEKAAAPGVTILLLDQLNTTFEDQVYAQNQVLEVLQRIPPNQRIGVYVLSRELKVVHDFTDSPTQLASVVKELQGQPSPALLGAQQEPLPTPISTTGANAMLLGPVDLMSRMTGEAGEYYKQYRRDVTLNAIEAIANHLASTSGRKNLIWLSGWFPFKAVLEGPYERAMRAVSNANVAIYPVDARGLIPLPEYDAGVNHPSGEPSPTLFIANVSALENLASDSGGLAFFNTNDLAKAIRSVLEDGRRTYTLGFYPASAADNKFHKLKVHVRRKDVTLRYRQGYVAAQGPAGTDTPSALREVLANALDTADIGITVKLEPSSVMGGAWTVRSIIDSADLALENRAGRRVGQLEVVYSVQDQTGKQLQGVRDEVSLDLKPTLWQEIQANGFALHKEFTPPANAATIRIVVYDPGTGRSGSVSVPLNPN